MVRERWWALGLLGILLGATPGRDEVLRQATIVTAADAPRVVAFAAAELRDLLRRCTGIELPLADDSADPAGPLLLVGRSAITDRLALRREFDDQAFLIKRVGNALALVGDDLDKPGAGPIPFDYRTSRAGTLYAVYTYLERFHGARWFWPGDGGEVLPKADGIAFPEVDTYDRPDFAWRHFWFLGDTLDDQVTNVEVPLWYLRNKMGIAFGSPSSFAHSWTGCLDGNANFAAHPDWYALVDGERRPFYLEENGKPKYAGRQVCTSNPEVVQQFVGKLRQLDPTQKLVASISPNDGSGFCECARCRALDHPGLYGPDEGYDGAVHSDRVYGFVNQVAREIRKTHPKLYLGLFSYTYLRPEPRALARLEDNVIVAMTQISALYNDPALKQSERERIVAWSKKHTKLLGRDYLGLYEWLNIAHPQTRVLAEDLRFLREHHYLGYYWEGAVDFATNHLNAWVAGRLMWDVDQDVEAVLGDYCDHGFGRAGQAVRAYHDQMEKVFMGRPVEATMYGAGMLPTIYSAEDLAKAGRFLDEAARLADGDEVRRRVEYVRLGHDLTEQTVTFLRLCQRLTDAGFPISLRRYEARPTTAMPSREQVAAWITEARERGRKLFTLLASLRGTAACQDYAHLRCDQMGRWRATLDEYHELYVVGAQGRPVALPERWRFRTDPDDTGEKQGWATPDFDDHDWPTIAITACWEKQGHDGYDGVAWYRLSDVSLPADQAGRRCVLRLGAVDESCWVYVNGRLAGSFRYDPAKDEESWKKPQQFDLTRYVTWDRPNVLAIKVHDSGFAGGLWQGAQLLFPAAEAVPVLDEQFETDAWHQSASVSGADHTVEVTGEPGQRVLKVTVSKPLPAQASLTWAKVPVEPGATYALRVRYRVDRAVENAAEKETWRRRPGLPTARVIFADAAGKACVPAKQYVWASGPFTEQTADWVELRQSFVTPAAARQVSLTLFFNAEGDYRLDTVRIEKW